MTRRPPFLAWPGWPHLGETALLGGAQLLWWIFVYTGADWLAGLRSQRMHLHFDFELNIPLVPVFLLAYRSVDPMFLLGPFVLRRRAELRALVAALFGATTIAGLFFVLLPAEVGYPPPVVGGIWQPLFAFNAALVLHYNLAPSLHVALATVTLSAFGRERGRVGRFLLGLWCGLIALSTLLVWQHHLIDVATGFLLGWACYRLIYCRWLQSLRSSVQCSVFSVQ